MLSFKQLGNMGRQGNQLFQLATTIALALRNNDTYIFPHCELEHELNLYNCFSDNITTNYTYNEPHFHYTEIPYRPNMNLSGFFQSYKYFDDCKDIIRGLLMPRNMPDKKWGTTSIHVRRTDYVNQHSNNYAHLDMNYYQKAMNIIQSPNYIVFSDDIEWCKRNFKGNNIMFSENKSPIEDLKLMIGCENQVIANSSFSWFSAWLNTNPSKIVIAPEQWFGPGLSHHHTQDLIPPTWQKI